MKKQLSSGVLRAFLPKIFLSIIVTAALSSPLAAQSFTVTSNGDTHAVSPTTNAFDAGGQITLRSALESSTQRAGTHVITIPAAIGTTINLTLGQIIVGNSAVGNNITVNGPGKTLLTINQTTQNRIFSTGLNAVTFTLTDLTLNYAGPTVASSMISGGGGAIQSGGTNAVTTYTNIAVNNFNIQIGNGGAILCSASAVQTITITNCDFNNNYCGGGGGALSVTGNGTCTITNCTFSNNKTGAIGAAPGGMNTGGDGGALNISGSGSGGTNLVEKCTFINNTVLNSAGPAHGGAINHVNGTTTVRYCRFIGNTAAIGTGNAFYQSGGSAANVLTANDNWWGTNSGPNANDFAVGAAPVTAPVANTWLQIKTSVSTASICGGATSTITASFLSNSASTAIAAGNLTALVGLPITFNAAVNGTLSSAQTTLQSSGTATVIFTGANAGGSGTANAVFVPLVENFTVVSPTITVKAAPSIGSSPSASTSCAGLPVSFTGTANNHTSLVWQESTDAGFTTPTTLTNAGIYSGVATGTLTISDNTTVNGKFYRLVASNSDGCPSANSAGALLTATTPSLPTTHITLTQTVNQNNNLWYGASCALITKVVPSGGAPIVGNVTTDVWRESAVPKVAAAPFVQRHYQITPANSPSTASGTVTLYFTQAEFDNFNSDPASVLNLPTGTADAPGKANLRVAKYSGTTNDGTGLPGSYTGSVTVIDPPDANIVFNSTFSRWEIMLDVTGFSGFIVQTSLNVLPIKLVSFSAERIGDDAQIKWKTEGEINNDHFEVERSIDGRIFTTVTNVPAINGAIVRNYAWLDANVTSLTSSRIYYRLKSVSIAGVTEYSNIIVIDLNKAAIIISGIKPNPFIDYVDIQLNLPKASMLVIQVTDMTGRILKKGKAETPKGFSTYHLQGLEKIVSGVYLISIDIDGVSYQYRLVK